MRLGCQKLLKSNPIKFDINSPKYQNDLKFFIQVAESVVNLCFKFHLNIQILKVPNSRKINRLKQNKTD